MRENNITGCEGLIGAHSNVHIESNHGLPKAHQTSPVCRNLVLASSLTTSGETSARAPWTIAERASSTGICLAKLPLNLDQAPTSQHYKTSYRKSCSNLSHRIQIIRTSSFQHDDPRVEGTPKQQQHHHLQHQVPTPTKIIREPKKKEED